MFDDILTPAFRNRGIDGLVEAVGGLIREALFLPSSPFGKQERSGLQDLMIDDLVAVKRHLTKREEDPARERANRDSHVRNRCAAGYIRKRCQGAVTIMLDYQPMMGGG